MTVKKFRNGSSNSHLARASFVAVLTVLILIVPRTGFGAAHSWDITEVFSNADGTVQFVELQEQFGSPSELGMPGQFLMSNAHMFTIGGSTPFPTANKHYLIATAAFAALPGAPTPDVIIAPGFVPFINTAGDSIQYVPYDTVSFIAGELPTDGVNSLFDDGSTGVNSPTNYAGETGSVNGPPPPPSPTPVPGIGLVGGSVIAGLLALAGITAAKGRRSESNQV